MKRKFAMRLRVCALALLLLGVVGEVSHAGAQTGTKQYWDKEYAFGFRFPAGWKLRPFPEGEGNRGMRVVVEAPDGGSLMVVIEKLESRTDRTRFGRESGSKPLLEKMARETIDRIYRTINKNIGATGMNVGEVRDVSSPVAAKYYIATLHQMPAGRALIVAGIHALPFGKAHRVDFIMTSPWNEAAKSENRTMMMAFNSFYLLGESGPTGSGEGQKPDEPGN